MFALLVGILIVVCLLLLVVVLLQAGTGGGLAAMGGGASTDTFFGGRQAVTILTKGSWWLGGIFLFLALVLAGMSTRTSAPRSVLDGQPTVPPAPVAPPGQLPLDVTPEPQGGGENDPSN
jgi:preprotein translocase subunit SecG